MSSILRLATRSSLATAVTLMMACHHPAHAPAPPDSVTPGCATLTLERAGFQFDMFGTVTGVRYRVTPNLGGEAPDFLILELYDSTTSGLPPLTTGTFDLSVPPDDNLATCQHCLWLWQDFEEGGIPNAIYYATSGSLVLDTIEDPLSIIMAGQVSEVALQPATIDETTGDMAFVDGACLSVPTLAFDTNPTPGRACNSAEDCGNAFLEVCDPKTATCDSIQCDEMNWCPDGETCVSQLGEAFQGACYTLCDPTNSACPSDQVCTQFGVDPSYGVCRHIGSGALGAPCKHEDVSTSCDLGLECETSSESCLPTCDFFAATTGCTEGNTCYVLGDCYPSTTGSAAGIGEPCGDDAALADGCANDGQAFRGICFAFEPSPLVCERACFGDLGCSDGEFCALRFTSGLGICQPNPICGDGALGEIGEVCDDGNTDSGDGCSGDCQTVEYDVLCAAPTTLAATGSVTDTTLGGIDGFMSSCQFGIARSRLYSIAPTGRGRLHLKLESATYQALAIREVCADSASESGCAANAGTIDTFVQLDSQHPGPVTVLVTAESVLEEGPFTLTSEFVAELCGDGIVEGDEVCDDGNTTSGDGCSADCRTIVYGELCADAPLLSTIEPNTGTTEDGLPYFESSCSNTNLGSGPDHIYRYVAPSDGSLDLVLAPADILVSLAVFDDCGAPGTVQEIGCSPSFLDGRLSISMSAGQSIVVLVEGFGARDLGTYSLTATFTP